MSFTPGFGSASENSPALTPQDTLCGAENGPWLRRSTRRTQGKHRRGKKIARPVSLARAVLRLFNHLHGDSITYGRSRVTHALRYCEIPRQARKTRGAPGGPRASNCTTTPTGREAATSSPPARNPATPNSCNSAAPWAPDHLRTRVPDARRTWRSGLRSAPCRTAYRDARPRRRPR